MNFTYIIHPPALLVTPGLLHDHGTVSRPLKAGQSLWLSQTNSLSAQIIIKKLFSVLDLSLRNIPLAMWTYLCTLFITPSIRWLTKSSIWIIRRSRLQKLICITPYDQILISICFRIYIYVKHLVWIIQPFYRLTHSWVSKFEVPSLNKNG